MYSRILVPLDGSELAEAVLSTAHALAGMGPGTLYLVRAVAASNEPEARRYLERLAAYLREHGVVVEAQALRGQPVAVVVEEAARREVDLIVMSTHGRAGAGRWVLGSVADEVLHRTACPVLLLRAGQAGLAARPRRVLVPLDGSELAEHALAHATSLVGTEGEVLLYHVLPAAAPEAERTAPGADRLGGDQAEARRYLEGVAAAPRGAGYRLRVAVELGSPVPRIVDYARQERADLIVLSSHGRAGVARWLLGSVADQLVRTTSVPVLVLRPLLAPPAAPGPPAETPDTLPPTAPRGARRRGPAGAPRWTAARSPRDAA